MNAKPSFRFITSLALGRNEPNEKTIDIVSPSPIARVGQTTRAECDSIHYPALQSMASLYGRRMPIYDT